MSDPLRDHPQGCELDLLVAPRAARSQVVGVHDGRLKVQLAAPPVDGAANAELVEVLADALDLPKSALTVVRGQTGRRKTVRIAGLAAALARARLGLGALAAVLLAGCTAEIPFPVRVILPEETVDLDRADNLALELSPQGVAVGYEVEGTEFSISLELPPDDVARTLSLYLADGTELLAHGRSAPFVLLQPPGDLAVLLARPGTLSTFPGDVAEPDPDLLAAHAPGLGMMLLGSGGDIVLLNETNYEAEAGARLDPEGDAPPPTDGALLGDDVGLVWRVAWAEGVRAFTFDPPFDVWTTLDLAGDVRPRPGAAWAQSHARDRLWIAGGGAPDVLELPLLVGDGGTAGLQTIASLDGPRPGAALVPVRRGDAEHLLVVGGGDELPAAYLPGSGVAFGPTGAWSGLRCVQLDPSTAAGELRVLCLGGLRGGAPTADALLVHLPPDPAGASAEDLPDFFAAPLPDPRLFADDLAVYAQQGTTWQRIARGDLTSSEATVPALRERGGHSLTLGTGVTFLVGGRGADDQPVKNWWVFAPSLPPP